MAKVDKLNSEKGKYPFSFTIDVYVYWMEMEVKNWTGLEMIAASVFGVTKSRFVMLTRVI